MDIERVQKSAMKVILKDKYVNYKQALKLVDLESLHARRERLCLKFAKKCLKIENLKKLFPLREVKHEMKKRNTEKYLIKHINTERYMKSAIPAMQRALNKEVIKMSCLLPENIVNYNSISVKIQLLLFIIL